MRWMIPGFFLAVALVAPPLIAGRAGFPKNSDDRIAMPPQRGRQVPQGAAQVPKTPPLDVSNDVTLTATASRARYEQLEPIKLQLALANKSKEDMTFEDEGECQLFGFEIVDLTNGESVADLTRYGKGKSDKDGRGPITVGKQGGAWNFAAYPNLCVDMTAPSRYSIIVKIKLKRKSDGRDCITRSKPIRVEVTHLRNGR